MAKDSVKVINGTNTTVSKGTDGNATTYAVNVSDDAIKGAVKTDLAGKADVDATNITGDNLTKWQTKLGNGAIASGSTGFINGDTLFTELRPTDGKYVKNNQSTAANLNALDTQVSTNTNAISTNKTNIAGNTTEINSLKNLSNITEDGKKVVRDLSQGAVKVINGKNTTVSEGTDGNAKTYAVNVSNDAIKDAVKVDMDKKADVDATNITGDNLTKWQTKLGNGTIASGNTGLVTGGTIFNEVRPADGTYVKNNQSTATNLKSLDTQVKANTDSISSIQTQINSVNDNAVKYDDSNKSKVTLAGQNGTTIAHVKDGDISSSSSEAINGKQLNAEKVAREAEDKAINDKIGTLKDGTYIKKNDTISDNLNNLDTQVKKNTDQIAENTKNISQNTSDIAEIKKNTTQITTDMSNKANKDLDNISDAGRDVIKNLAQDAVDVKGSDNVTVTNETKDGTKTFKVKVDGNGKVASGDKGLISGDTLYNEVRPTTDGSYIKQTNTTAQNLTNLDTQVKKTSDLINSDGKTIKIGGSDAATKVDVSGKDSSGNSTSRVITGVKTDANDSTSAASVGYVNDMNAANTQQIYHDMNSAYSHVENDISRAAAGSNALAALHPMQEFDPDDKAQYALGYGHYRNSNAGAVGVFYQPDENSLFSLGASFGNGDAGINAGVTFKFGPGGSGHHALTKTQMAKVIDAQSKEIDALKKDNADKDKRIDALEQKVNEILAKVEKDKA